MSTDVFVLLTKRVTRYTNERDIALTALQRIFDTADDALAGYNDPDDEPPAELVEMRHLARVALAQCGRSPVSIDDRKNPEPNL